MVRAVFRGDVDLDGVDVVALRAAVLRDGAFEAPGVALFWNAAHAAFARDGAAVCVCTGRPRFTDADLATQASSDPAATWLVDAYALASRSRNTPYAGRKLTGRVRHTIFQGEPVVIDCEAQR